MTLLYYPTCHDPSRTNLDRGHQPEATCRAVSRAHALHGPERHPQPAKLLALTRKPAVVEERAGQYERAGSPDSFAIIGTRGRLAQPIVHSQLCLGGWTVCLGTLRSNTLY